jgi:plasmid stability protein
MNVSINFPSDLEDSLRRRAAAQGQDIETYVRQVVTESLVQEDEPTDKSPTPAEFARRLDAWIALHPVLDHAIDDSRESIYAGRGE